jgi:hypothetical protein
MSTYKVIQDVEADDKLVGPLSVRQFVYAAIAGLGVWLSVMAVTKSLAFMLVFLVPIVLFTGFFAFPWGGDQPTELWALAKIRFMLKPRKRIWNQSGAKDVVTITVPKKIERVLTNGLTQTEVQSRLSALADTIDSRGWAIKNMNINLAANPVQGIDHASDRLVPAVFMPQQVSDVEVFASDDVLDPYANPTAHKLDAMIQNANQTHRQQIIEQIQQPIPPIQPEQAAQQNGPNYWFTQPPEAPVVVPPQIITPNNKTVDQPDPARMQAVITDERLLAQKLKEANANVQHPSEFGGMRTIKTPEQIAAQQAAQAEAQRQQQASAEKAKAAVTPEHQAAIINFARNNDHTVAAISRQANEEVVIPLR